MSSSCLKATMLLAEVQSATSMVKLCVWGEVGWAVMGRERVGLGANRGAQETGAAGRQPRTNFAPVKPKTESMAKGTRGWLG